MTGYSYHGGKGSELRTWCWREASEVVSWERRWRVCSRVLMSAGESVVAMIHV